MFVARPIGEMVITLPSQGNIHGFESHVGHHMLFKVPYLGTFLFMEKILVNITLKIVEFVKKCLIIQNMCYNILCLLLLYIFFSFFEYGIMGVIIGGG